MSERYRAERGFLPIVFRPRKATVIATGAGVVRVRIAGDDAEPSTWYPSVISATPINTEGVLMRVNREDVMFVPWGVAVGSVNGSTGVVVLDADDIEATATRLWLTTAERTKLTNTSGTNTGDQNLAPYALTSSLATVATSGAYADLTGTPTLHTHANQAVLDATTASFLLADETKLDGIATGATANATDAQLRDRATHTGEQAISTVTGLQTALDAKADDTDLASYLTTAAAPELIRDTMGTALVAGTNVTITPNDAGDTITIAAAGGGGATNLTATLAASQITVNSDTGTDAVLPAADGTNAGLLLPAEKSKLAGIATGAEVNVQADWNAASGDAQILNKPTVYTQAEVDTLIASFKPQTFSHLAAENVAATAAGTYVFTGVGFTVTGLTPLANYTVEASVQIAILTNASARSLRPIFRATGNTTVDTNEVVHWVGASTTPTLHGRGSLTVAATSGGNITIRPAYIWVSGSISTSSASITATITKV